MGNELKTELYRLKADERSVAKAQELNAYGSLALNLLSSATQPRAPSLLSVPNAGRDSYDLSARLENIAFFNAKEKLRKKTGELYHQIEHLAHQAGQTPEIVKGIMLENVTEEHETAMRVLELNHVTSLYSTSTLALQSEQSIINNRRTADYQDRVTEHEAKRQRIASTLGVMTSLISLL